MKNDGAWIPPTPPGAPGPEDLSEKEYMAALEAAGRKPIRFVGGPYDGKAYVGTAMPPMGHYGCWDEHKDRGRQGVQLVRHTYQLSERSGHPCWVFVKTEAGPTAGAQAKPKGDDRKRRRR